MISTGLTSRQIGATTASHQSAPPHHMPQGPIDYPWVRGGDDSGRYYRRRPLTLYDVMVDHEW